MQLCVYTYPIIKSKNQPSFRKSRHGNHNSPDSGLILAHWMAWLHCRCRQSLWSMEKNPWRVRFFSLKKCDDLGDEKIPPKDMWFSNLSDANWSYLMMKKFLKVCDSALIQLAHPFLFCCWYEYMNFCVHMQQNMTSKEGAGTSEAWQHRFLPISTILMKGKHWESVSIL